MVKIHKITGAIVAIFVRCIRASDGMATIWNTTVKEELGGRQESYIFVRACVFVWWPVKLATERVVISDCG